MLLNKSICLQLLICMCLAVGAGGRIGSGLAGAVGSNLFVSHAVGYLRLEIEVFDKPPNLDYRTVK